MNSVFNVLPRISLKASIVLAVACVLAALTAWAITPRLVAVENAPRLEETVPRRFGDWAELPSPYAQVSLSTGEAPNMDQPYDQTLMRTYVNSKGQVVMLALAWGAKQRQEVKVHRPDLCYVAQGHKVKQFSSAQFSGIAADHGPVIGSKMVTEGPHGGEAVMYWIRIGDIYSESAVATRVHILLEGISGRIPDGILVRASIQIRGQEDAQTAWPVMEAFLTDLVAATPFGTRKLMIR